MSHNTTGKVSFSEIVFKFDTRKFYDTDGLVSSIPLGYRVGRGSLLNYSCFMEDFRKECFPLAAR